MSFVINAVGDISFNGKYLELACSGETSGVLQDVTPALTGDLVIGNMESPLTSAQTPEPPWRYRLRGHPNFATTIKAAGFQVVTLGNNHAMDFGWPGLQETMQSLDKAGIKHVGAGKDVRDARQRLRLHVNDSWVSISSYCSVPVDAALYASESEPGVCFAHPEWIEQDIEEARKDSDVVIICLHWGEEHLFLPSPDQRALAKRVLGAGADLILGHHSHVLQPFEKIGNGAVVYSLGNFVFSPELWEGVNRSGARFTMNMKLRERHCRSAILTLTHNAGKLERLEWKPTSIEGERVRMDPRASRQKDIVKAGNDLYSPLYRLKWKWQSAMSYLYIHYRPYLPEKISIKSVLKIRSRHFRTLWGMIWGTKN